MTNTMPLCIYPQITTALGHDFATLEIYKIIRTLQPCLNGESLSEKLSTPIRNSERNTHCSKALHTYKTRIFANKIYSVFKKVIPEFTMGFTRSLLLYLRVNKIYRMKRR